MKDENEVDTTNNHSESEANAESGLPPSSQHDAEFHTEHVLPVETKASSALLSSKCQHAILKCFEDIIGDSNISADPNKNSHYRSGWRSGGGAALAVLFPQNLTELWHCLTICVDHGLVIIMQAANTGLTEGSTPNGNDYDRHVIVINTLAINSLHLLDNGKQVLSLPGATLHQLESELAKIGRSPHSVIGSSCLGASIVGGIANNSGGALVKRGPAYTELAVYAKVDTSGRLVLVNHLGLNLGSDAESVIRNLDSGNFDTEGVDTQNTQQGSRQACDKLYEARIKDVDADTPSRFNADPRRLFEASGCAGKLAVFAVRVQTHALPHQQASFYLGTNNPDVLYKIRRRFLSDLDDLPEVGEYMHRDIFDISEKYGKDTFLSVKHLGTSNLPRMFAAKGRVDAILNKISVLPKHFSDKILQAFSKLFPQHLAPRLLAYRDKYEHHLIIKLSDGTIEQGRDILKACFDNSENGEFFECNEDEAQSAYLNRFAAAGAAARYQIMHQKDLGELLSLDIALPRNALKWEEHLPEELAEQIDKKLYYGHFFCYVFHQDYVLKKTADATEVKKQMLKLLDERGAKYPAEHNVGHLYEAEDDLREFYKTLDPTNTFNPGIGKMEKTQRNCECCL